MQFLEALDSDVLELELARIRACISAYVMAPAFRSTPRQALWD
jgi:hypothetical protein